MRLLLESIQAEATLALAGLAEAVEDPDDKGAVEEIESAVLLIAGHVSVIRSDYLRY